MQDRSHRAGLLRGIDEHELIVSLEYDHSLSVMSTVSIGINGVAPPIEIDALTSVTSGSSVSPDT